MANDDVVDNDVAEMTGRIYSAVEAHSLLVLKNNDVVIWQAKRMEGMANYEECAQCTIDPATVKYQWRFEQSEGYCCIVLRTFVYVLSLCGIALWKLLMVRKLFVMVLMTWTWYWCVVLLCALKCYLLLWYYYYWWLLLCDWYIIIVEYCYVVVGIITDPVFSGTYVNGVVDCVIVYPMLMYEYYWSCYCEYVLLIVVSNESMTIITTTTEIGKWLRMCCWVGIGTDCPLCEHYWMWSNVNIIVIVWYDYCDIVSIVYYYYTNWRTEMWPAIYNVKWF